MRGLFLVAAVSACGPTFEPDPNPPSAVAATGRDSCADLHADRPAPLVVDLQPELRADLEVALASKVAVVRFDCPTLEVLPRCSAPGAYDYAGTGPKEQVIRMVDEASLSANLPLTAPALIGRLGADFERGATLDLALVMVGKRVASKPVLSSDDLTGECAGATHVVHSATVGAFAMKTASRTEAQTVAGIFGAGVSAGRERQSIISIRDGDWTRCGGASPSDEGPPPGCGAAVRVELLAVRPPPPPITVLSEEVAKTLRGKLCPDPEKCRTDCEAGDGNACGHWATLLAIGDRVPRDLGKSTRAFQRACQLDHMVSCTMLGLALLTAGHARADADAGRKMLERPCERGQAQACGALGQSYQNSGDAEISARYFKRACELGDRSACQ